MSINTSGPVSLGGGTDSVSIAFEIGVGPTTQISLNDTNVRALAGVPSGQITMPTDFYGKSTQFTFNRTISTNTQNYNLLNDMVANGYTNGAAFTANITVASGIYVWSDSTSLAGFDTGNITGTGTINITNDGFIIGKGGDASPVLPSRTTFSWATAVGAPGGPAMNTFRPLNITNNSFIAGGGGAANGIELGTSSGSSVGVGGGGGAGGGVGGAAFNYSSGSLIQAAGGAGGSIGNSGSAGVTNAASNIASGGGGGRILPGVGGAAVRNGANTFSSGAGGSGGGAGGNIVPPGSISSGFLPGLGGGAGGSGGVRASVGKTGSSSNAAGGGGGWGAQGGNAYASNTGVNPASFTAPSGGIGGKAINTNGNAITFITTGTVYGAVN